MTGCSSSHSVLTAGSSFQITVHGWGVLLMACMDFLIDNTMEFLEHYGDKHRMVKRVLGKIYRELMILGIMSLTILILIESNAVGETDWLLGLELAQIALFVVAIFYCVQMAVVIIVSVFWQRRLEVIEHHAPEQHEQRITKRRRVQNLLDFVAGVLGFRPHEIDDAFICLSHHFVVRYSLPFDFEFSHYVHLVLAELVSLVVNIRLTTWLQMVVVFAVVGAIAVGSGSVGEALTGMIIGYAFVSIGLLYWLRFVLHTIVRMVIQGNGRTSFLEHIAVLHPHLRNYTHASLPDVMAGFEITVDALKRRHLKRKSAFRRSSSAPVILSRRQQKRPAPVVDTEAAVEKAARQSVLEDKHPSLPREVDPSTHRLLELFPLTIIKIFIRDMLVINAFAFSYYALIAWQYMPVWQVVLGFASLAVMALFFMPHAVIYTTLLDAVCGQYANVMGEIFDGMHVTACLRFTAVGILKKAVLTHAVGGDLKEQAFSDLVDAMIAEFDVNGDGVLSHGELFCALGGEDKMSHRERAKILRIFDPDGDGSVTRAELAKLLRDEEDCEKDRDVLRVFRRLTGLSNPLKIPTTQLHELLSELQLPTDSDFIKAVAHEELRLERPFIFIEDMFRWNRRVTAGRPTLCDRGIISRLTALKRAAGERAGASLEAAASKLISMLLEERRMEVMAQGDSADGLVSTFKAKAHYAGGKAFLSGHFEHLEDSVTMDEEFEIAALRHDTVVEEPTYAWS